MQVIRVAERARELELLAGDRFSEEYEAALERVLRDLFAACPDCSDDAWEEIAEDFDATIGRSRVVPYCLERGYDVRREPPKANGGADAHSHAEDGPLVACWRDVGMMLLARDRGLIA